MRKLFLFVVSLCVLFATAQVMPLPNPIEKDYNGEVIITFDATKGSGGMVGASKCYAHTGLITSASSDNSDWKNVKGSWRETNQPQLTSIGNNKWQLVIPNIYSFYGVSTSTNIKALAFVFHDGPGGNKEGKANSGDIFIWLGEKVEGDIWETVEGITAVTKARPEGVSNGIYYDADDPAKVTLCTYAASRTEAAKRVFLLGDMTDWKLSADYQLFKDGNYFWITLTDLVPGKEYRFQYAVERADGVKKQICDLYSEKVLHPDDKWEPKTVNPTLIDYPTKGADGSFVTVIQTNKPQFEWSDATLNFKRPDKDNLIIYELWVYDYTTNRSLKGLIKCLDYIQNLGVNAVELMPVCEFEGNKSWGYNPSLYFALDKAYGTPDDLKIFVDECHKRGIAVILDMVFNHTNGTNPMAKLYPWTSASEAETDLRFNPWFNLASEVQHSDNNYGEDWNHDFEPAHEMFIRAMNYWVTEYKVDGYRFDLSHGFCGRKTYDAVENLKDYFQNGLQAVVSDGYMILEHWGTNMGNDRPSLIEAGMLCWANVTHAYGQAAMGWLKDGDGFKDANADGFVTYCESHDEERMQYKAKEYGAYNIKQESVRLGRVPACVAFNVLLNGSHMLWQFEEIGYDYSIDFNGRTDTKPNPSSLGYFTQAERVEAFTTCAQVITLRTQLLPEVFAGNPTSMTLTSGKKLRNIKWGSNVYAVANFDTISVEKLRLPSGTWYDYLEGGTKATTYYDLHPGELKVFTSSELKAPEFTDIQKRDNTPIEQVQSDNIPCVRGEKFLHNGQLFIRRGDRIYTSMGQPVY